MFVCQYLSHSAKWNHSFLEHVGIGVVSRLSKSSVHIYRSQSRPSILRYMKPIAKYMRINAPLTSGTALVVSGQCVDAQRFSAEQTRLK